MFPFNKVPYLHCPTPSHIREVVYFFFFVTHREVKMPFYLTKTSVLKQKLCLKYFYTSHYMPKCHPS